MSVVFLYTEQREPAAPFVLVDIWSPGASENRIDQLPAQVDSAADRTIVPLALVERLYLTPAGSATFSGLGGHEVTLGLYNLVILVRTLRPREITVAVHPDEPLILLGRDFLNQFKIILDRAAKRLEISDV